MEDSDYKIVVAGESVVGKTALTLQLIQGYFVPDSDPTIEDIYRKQCVIDDKVAILDILDTAPHNDFSAACIMQDQYMRAGEGFILVYSITDRSSFNGIQKYHQQILKVKETEYVPMILVANKMDRKKEKVVTSEDGQELAKAMKAGYVEASAMLGTNVEKAFYDLVRSIRRYRNNDTPETNITNKRTSRKSKKSSNSARKRCVLL